MNNSQWLIAVLLVAVVAFAGIAFWGVQRSVSPVDNTPNTTTPDVSSATTTKIKIALLDTTGNGSGESRGCDNVTMVERSVPKTSAPLSAALQTLFAEPEGTQPSTAYNFIARTKNTLKFDHATVVNGTASIYLTGSLSGLAGVCDDPRAQIQLEETALQFSTVQKVQIYLNGKATTLTPSEKGE
jgi:spore germination protein GerM